MVRPTPLHKHPGFNVRLGFVPLLDSAPLIVARELGLFDAEGLDVELVREGSWASLRDKVSFGLLDGGHMLAPMPLSMSLATDRPKVPVVVGMVLSRNGNGITLSARLHHELTHSATDLENPIATARALIRVARGRGEPIRLASVAPWSSHDLQLRDWLASAGPDAEQHVQIIPVSPIQMVDAFRSNTIEGCCVGEPWNSLLEYEKLGHILHSGHQIWQNAPEKVLGMRAAWATCSTPACCGHCLQPVSGWITLTTIACYGTSWPGPSIWVNRSTCWITTRTVCSIRDCINTFFATPPTSPGCHKPIGWQPA